MNNNEIDFQKFIEYVHTHFKDEIDLNSVKEILYLEDGYNKDNPESLGRHLVLNRLIFSGKKNDTEFIYDQPLYTGINIWIADNFKGKSSIFKIIKFALTGIESYKHDIKKWIAEIILEFQIGKDIYTIHIDKSGRDKGSLYTFGIDRFQQLRDNQKLDTIDKEKEFDFRSKKMLEEHMQEFFFDHFDFYVLKYTQNRSSKEDFGLSTANLSWSTYFKSIYLESSNYEYLFFENEKFGAQGRKIFEMILGLPLTYPINMLTIQSDRVSEEIGKLKLADTTNNETVKSERDKVSKEYSDVTEKLQKIRKEGKLDFDENPLIEEYNQIQERVNENRKKRRSANEAYQSVRDNIEPLEIEIKNLEIDRKKVAEEISRLVKQELNIELYKEAGSFFSNLDIKVCPHCEIEVTKERKEKELNTHECSLCGETSNEQKIETEELQAKLNKLKEEREGHQKRLQQLRKSIESVTKRIQELRITIPLLYNELIAVPSTEADLKRLKEIEAEIEMINKERKDQQDLIKQEKDLLKEEAVLKYRLEEIEKEKTSENSNRIQELNLHKSILNYALEGLEKRRIQLNKNILTKLETLIQNEIHAFGIHNISNLKITNKYELEFTQNDEIEGFSDLTEGEKLRVKLAFYLSLIQLDIEHNLGRHPRFLIFDSPGSEEMIEEHLRGLSDILKKVNERFEDELQIFVGSALREFSQITSTKKAVIKGKDEFIF